MSDMNDDDLLEADQEFQKALKAFFLKNYKSFITDIKNLLDTGDFDSAYRMVHSLKGNAGQIGKTDLQKTAMNVEQFLKGGMNNVTEDMLNALDAELKIVLEELASVLGADV